MKYLPLTETSSEMLNRSHPCGSGRKIKHILQIFDPVAFIKQILKRLLYIYPCCPFHSLGAYDRCNAFVAVYKIQYTTKQTISSLTCIPAGNNHDPVPGDGIFGKRHPSSHGYYRVMRMGASQVCWYYNGILTVYHMQTELCSFFKPLRTNSREHYPLFTGQ